MSIVLVSGTSAHPSNTSQFAMALVTTFLLDYKTHIEPVAHLPLFKVDMNSNHNQNINRWKQHITNATAVIIITPAYLHNIPASIKSALEWLTHDGELSNKPTLPILYTPHAPRGEKAMQSLLWSLQALDANVVGSLQLHKTEVKISDKGELVGDSDMMEMIEEAVRMLTGV